MPMYTITIAMKIKYSQKLSHQHEGGARLNSKKTPPVPFETYPHLVNIHFPIHKKAPLFS